MMEMKHYILNTFKYNDYANRMVLEKIKELPDKNEAIKFFSHLINCQYKWMARVIQDPQAPKMSWWEPLYEINEMAEAWADSLKLWTAYISSMSDEELSKEVTYIGNDGGMYAA